jgi:hypothetical protein
MAYLRRFLVTLVVLLGAIAAANGMMDATGLLHAPVITGVNQTKAPGTDRFFKPLAIERRQPRAVFVGTSRVAVGLDPHDLPDDKAYNLGLLGSTIPEQIAFARYAIANASVERVIFGLDYASFIDQRRYSSAFRLAILEPYAFWRALPDLLLSQRELLQSRVTLTASSHHAKPRYADDGMLIVANENPDSPDPVIRALNKVEQYARAYHWAGDVGPPLAEFDAFLAALPPRVAIAVYITPAHAAVHEALKPRRRDGDYEDWLRRVSDVCARHNVPLWDFNGYNRITTVPLVASAEYFADGAHSIPAVGRLILARMLHGAGDADFGVRLTPEMLAGYLAVQGVAGAAWQRDHPDDARLAAAAAAKGDAMEAARGSP